MERKIVMSLQVNELNFVKTELGNVLSIVREDFDSVEAKQQAKELQSLIHQQTGTPADEELFKELKVVDRLTSIGYYRDWLFTYKGRGYVIADLGNQWMAYRCTAEEFLMSLRLESEDKIVAEVA